MCTLYINESTQVMLEHNQDGENFGLNLFGVVGDILTAFTDMTELNLIMKKIEALHNIYNLKTKRTIPILFSLYMKSLNYLYFSIPHLESETYKEIMDDIVNLCTEINNSKEVFSKYIADIKESIDVYDIQEVEWPSKVQQSIDNRREVETDFIYMIKNLSQSTTNFLNSLICG